MEIIVVMFFDICETKFFFSFRGGEQFAMNWFDGQQREREGEIIKFEYLTRFTLEQSNR